MTDAPAAATDAPLTERDLQITYAINRYAYLRMGLDVKPAEIDLEAVSLREMCEAVDRVRAYNEAETKRFQETRSTTTIYIAPDPRLVAAVYTLLHYDIDREAIVYRPKNSREDDAQDCVAGLAVFPLGFVAGEESEGGAND